jgi:gas vesicle protein
MNKFMSFVTGAIAGAVVGAAVALLLTPASGDELQEQTRDWMESLWGDARRAAEEKRSELEDQLTTLKRQTM